MRQCVNVGYTGNGDGSFSDGGFDGLGLLSRCSEHALGDDDDDDGLWVVSRC